MGCIPRIHLKEKKNLQFALDIRSNTASSHEKEKKNPPSYKKVAHQSSNLGKWDIK